MGFLFIICSVACSLAIAQFLKAAELKKLSVIKVLVVNYLVAFLVSLFVSVEYSSNFTDLEFFGWLPLVLIIILGSLFILNMVIYSRSIDQVGMGISIAAMRTSLVFPIGLSIFLYGEFLQVYKYSGLVLAFIALYLMLPSINWKRISDHKNLLLPIGIFLMTGLADSGLKIYEQEISDKISVDLFLSGVFLVSFLTGMMIMVKRGNLTLKPGEIIFGVLTGLVNLYSSVFLLFALAELPGSLVFPVTNVAVVILGTVIGLLFWKDELSKKQITGLVLSVISILILVI